MQTTPFNKATNNKEQGTRTSSGAPSLMSLTAPTLTPSLSLSAPALVAPAAPAAVNAAVPAALGLSEAQLLDADIVGADGKDLGDVSQVLRGTDDKVDRLLVELDGIGPDRYVHVPVQGLKVVVRGDDTDLQTSMTKADLDALPEVKLPAP